ncbi:hypothetical protein GEMRC1_010096 [Eukaryota sp. GEM-RC1]
MPLTSDVLLALRTINELRSLKTHASEDTRVRACAALLFNSEEVARFYSVSQSTVSRWLKDSLDSSPDENRGRKRILSDEEVSTLLEVIDSTPLLFLRELQQLAVTYFGKSVCLSSIRRVLQRAGLSHKAASHVIKHTKRNLIVMFEIRLETQIGCILQEQLLFIDEVSFRQEHFQRMHGWSKSGTTIFGMKKRFPERQLSLVVAMDIQGYVCSFLQEGHFNRIGFIDFLKYIISSGITSKFPGIRSVIVLDGCNIHRSPDLYEGMRKSAVKYFILPPYSPESNPIESFFSMMRKRVRDLSYCFPDALVAELITTSLESLRGYNCRPLFQKAGWNQRSFTDLPILLTKI